MLMAAVIRTWPVHSMERLRVVAGRQPQVTEETIFSLQRVLQIKPIAGRWYLEPAPLTSPKALPLPRPEPLSLEAISLRHSQQVRSRSRIQTTMDSSLDCLMLEQSIGLRRLVVHSTTTFSLWMSTQVITSVLRGRSLVR